jgi:hypothetical protein
MFKIPSEKNEDLYGVFYLSIEGEENLILAFGPEGGEDGNFRCGREKGGCVRR